MEGIAKKIGIILAVVLVAALAAGTAAMAKGAALTYIEGQVIGTIDPAKHTDESSLHAVINLYDPLLYPKDQEGLMEPGPHIATGWKISDDGTKYIFAIRKGVRFHDGTELNAEDVKFSVDRALALKKGYSWLWQGVVKDVSVVDDYTVAFQLEQPYAPFLSTLIQLFILNKDLVLANMKAGDFGEFGDYGQAFLENNDAGSGPYTKARWTRGAEFVFDKFADYWRGWKQGQVDKVYYKIVLEEATKKTLLRSGQADMIDQWNTVETFQELQRARGVVVDEQPSVQLFHLPIHTQKAPTDNIHVRRALAYAFDYDTALKHIMKGAVQAQGPVPIKAYAHNDDVSVFHLDLEKAKEELAKSGYKPGDIKLQYVYASSVPIEQKVGLLLQSNLQQIGIDLEVIPEPWARMTELASTKASTPHLMGIFDTLKYPHADSHTWGMYHPSSWGSYRSTAWLDDKEVQDALEQARRAVDVKEQVALYKNAQQLIVDLVPSIYIANPVHRIAYRDYVKGYTYVGLLGYDIAFYNFTIEE